MVRSTEQGINVRGSTSDRTDYEMTGSEDTPLVGSRLRGNDVRKNRSFKERCNAMAAITAAVLALSLCIFVLIQGWITGWGGFPTVENGIQNQDQMYDSLGRYVLEDYDTRPPFSDFLPALAGYYGKPLYAFYVNRGQAIASFGVESKNFPIMEFNSANIAYQNVAFVGFRTFIQGSRKGEHFLTEPFSPLTTRHSQLAGDDNFFQLPKRRMYIGPNEVQLQELDSRYGIETNVTYFILPEESFGAFVKRTSVQNTGKSPITLSMLDGLAKMEPAGGKLNKMLKSIGRTLEAWMNVYSPYNDSLMMPFYRLSTQPQDTAVVVIQEAGHYCLSVLEDGDYPTLLPIVFDTSKIFGDDTSLTYPIELNAKTVGEILKAPQYGAAKTPSAFSALEERILLPGESITISTFFGKANHILDVPVIARPLLQPGWCEYKHRRSREIVKQITAAVETETSNQLFDGHVQQMFLDNSLRGGVPSILGSVDDDADTRNQDEDGRLKTLHLFSRVHGDLERDYNNFIVRSTFLSAGPGNFRDVAQNRRNDIVFNPRIGSFNVKLFLSLIQADGYNPLKVESVVFLIKDFEVCKLLATKAVGPADGHRAQREALAGILQSGPFRPGQLFLLMEEQGIELIISRQDFIDAVAAAAEFNPMAVYDTGFWADHWTYIMEHVHSYLKIYPDWEERIMYDDQVPFFFSPASVRPRSEKYVLSTSFNGFGKHVRQLYAVVEDKDKLQYQRRFINRSTGWHNLVADWQHDANGTIVRVSPISKLFLLAVVKYSTRDPYGMGIEYEADRPGWNDANNGLVGMIGSGMPETYELVVLLRYIKTTVSRIRRDISVPVELSGLFNSINQALHELDENRSADDMKLFSARVPTPLFIYWDKVATAREKYRQLTRLNFNGKMEPIPAENIVDTLSKWLLELDRGIELAHLLGSLGYGDDGNTHLTPTYFSYNVTEWILTGNVNQEGHPLVEPLKMWVNRFPLFLEGPTRLLKTVERAEAKTIYHNVRVSPLRDEELKMYTISASLKGQSFDMGREMAFASGWLENQSVWLHMSYKFYLQLLEHELFDEFFHELKSGGMLPFMDPEKYGRSLMECSSFIASSAFEDPSVRGRGFLARLSGSTAEFLSIWSLMMLGPQPFFVSEGNGELKLQLLPALPRWLFKDQGNSTATIKFKLFGVIEVTYIHNLGDESLYRVPPTRYVVGLRDGSTFNITGPSIPGELADKIRRVVFVESIEAYFE